MKFIRPATLTAIILFIIVGVNKIGDSGIEHTRVWTIEDSKAYARDKIEVYADKQWQCLDKLWTAESHWREKAYNHVKVMGKNAGGIPQILDMSTKLKPTSQIDRGLSYIEFRYITPCRAWEHHLKKGWY
jgi:hypothetical protein